MDHRLFDIIACPVCFGKLEYDKVQQVLICPVDRLAYPICDGIPMLLESEAQLLTDEESAS